VDLIDSNQTHQTLNDPYISSSSLILSKSRLVNVKFRRCQSHNDLLAFTNKMIKEEKNSLNLIASKR
jgi:hypothetical protein